MNKGLLMFTLTAVLVVSFVVVRLGDKKIENNEALPDWIHIEQEGDRRLVDYESGYQIHVGDSVVEYENGQIVLDRSVDPHGDTPPQYIISVEQNTEMLSLEEWLEKKHMEEFILHYETREPITFDRLEGIKIKHEGLGDAYTYYFANKDKIHIITSWNIQGAESIIASLIFIE